MQCVWGQQQTNATHLHWSDSTISSCPWQDVYLSICLSRLKKQFQSGNILSRAAATVAAAAETEAETFRTFLLERCPNSCFCHKPLFLGSELVGQPGGRQCSPLLFFVLFFIVLFCPPGFEVNQQVLEITNAEPKCKRRSGVCQQPQARRPRPLSMQWWQGDYGVCVCVCGCTHT